MKHKSRPLPEFWSNAKPPIIVAHRGGDGAGIEKENSLSAFHAAYNLGYRWFETDVVPTKDSKLLAIHGRGYQLRPNKDLPRRLTIQRINYEDIKHKYLIGGEPVVLLEELLIEFPDVKFFVDPKTAKAARCLSKLLKTRPQDLDRVCVGSFFLKRSWQVAISIKRATGKEVCTSMLGPASAWPTYWAVKMKALKPFARQYVQKSRAHSVHVPYSWVTSSQKQAHDFIEFAHSMGLKVAVYTPNTEESIRLSLERGVDVVMSDRVGVLEELANKIKG